MDYYIDGEYMDTAKRTKANALKIYNMYLSNDACMFAGTPSEDDSSELIEQFTQKTLPIGKSISAYRVATEYTGLEKEVVKKALLEGCDPEEVVQCSTGEEVAKLIRGKELMQNLLAKKE